MIFLYSFIFCIIGYFFGCLIFGQFIAWSQKKDLTESGSTNVGSTNVKRVMGPAWAFLVAVLDACKGIIAIVLCAVIYKYSIYKINPDPNYFCLVYLAGLFAVIGHCFPIQYLVSLFIYRYNLEKTHKFKGGKGVATTGGVLFSISPYLGLIAFLTWLIIVLITRYVSLGSLFCMTVASLFVFIPAVGDFYLFNASLIFPLRVELNIRDAYNINPWLMCGTFLIILCNDIILTIKHRPNIERLINNTESKLF